MAKNELINLFCFGEEIGRLGFDEHQQKSYFQYNPSFLDENKYLNLFPDTRIIKRTKQTQVFSRFNNETFRGLPPMIADSLPDLFGNIIFKKWLESGEQPLHQISVLEQLSYVSDRGMGALEYYPAKVIPDNSTIDLEAITHILKEVLSLKENTLGNGLNSEALLTIFKIGTSAGGVRPKILVSENKQTGELIPGDRLISSEFNHYIIKLFLEDDPGYNREVIEYCYYLTAVQLGIQMMPSKLIEQKHFATLRFDRQNGVKKHVLTATGLSGWDFKSSKDSSYENLFELALFLKVPHAEMDELFRRMVFNLVFHNTDDHLKNHSFIYNEQDDKWNLAPAYDLTYSLNPLINYKRSSRALSINGKRMDIDLNDVLTIADNYTIKNARNLILNTQNAISFWVEKAIEHQIPPAIIQNIQSDFQYLIKQ